jgi:4-phosphopantoate---beta-alanine ligase
MIPTNHPRYESLIIREKIINAYKNGILAEAGMIAHGRGEAFDYLIGEYTTETAKKAIQASAAALILAKNPVISVNGNTVALTPNIVVKLAYVLDAKIEINLFHRTKNRINSIERVLKNAGAKEVLGLEKDLLKSINGLEGPRSVISAHGISKADVILVPLEDGDRTEALISKGKFVIAIDLNPLSRTSENASITIVDNLIRAMPLLLDEVLNLKNCGNHEITKILKNFDNSQNLEDSLKIICKNVRL